MIVSGLVKSSLVDYPGKLACVLFVPGCNYNCFYCHNRSLLDGTHEVIPLATVETFLNRRAGQLDGVVISGGEPTLQSDLANFIQKLKSMGYLVKLDTNGSNPKVIQDLLQKDLCDTYAVDYKAPADRYGEVCGHGCEAQSVLETIGLLSQYQADFQVRTTVIPQLDEDDLIRMAKELPIVPAYVLNRYRQPEKFLPADTQKIMQEPYSPAAIKQMAEVLRSYQPNISA